jgi:HAD superfamily hydrolase (TIGR01484 family)
VRPVSSLPPEEAARLRGLLFDLDDTVLTHGVLTRGAFDALWTLHDAGLLLVAVTGRPFGWADVIARQWPVAGCVAENGALYVVRDGAGLRVCDACDDKERLDRRQRLERLADRVRNVVPEACPTDDRYARRSDYTWDIGERARLPDDSVRAIIREIESAGARWSLSSIHLHATFDGEDKASGAVRFCARELGEDEGSATYRFAFVGDSSNDAPCFSAFRTTFGVDNVRSAVARLSLPPRYVASRPMGEGFAEIAEELLGKRRA